jgi:hypothetical protein
LESRVGIGMLRRWIVSRRSISLIETVGVEAWIRVETRGMVALVSGVGSALRAISGALMGETLVAQIKALPLSLHEVDQGLEGVVCII